MYWVTSATPDAPREPQDEPTDEEAEYLSVLASMPEETLSEHDLCMMFLEQGATLTTNEGMIL